MKPQRRVVHECLNAAEERARLVQVIPPHMKGYRHQVMMEAKGYLALATAHRHDRGGRP